MMPVLFSLPGNESFAAALRVHWPVEAGRLELHRFPDGESLVRLEGDVRGRDAVILCTLNDPDAKLAPLLFAASAARDMGARSVMLIAPYLAYMRQDLRFHAGESLSAAAFSAVLSSAFDALVTVDPHLHRYHSLRELYQLRSAVAPAAPALAQWIEKNVSRPLIVGPDAESQQWVRLVADAIGAPSIVMEKQRKGDHEVSVHMPDLALHRGRRAVLLDDIVSTGQTLLAAADALAMAGYAAPTCVAVHAVVAAPAYDTLRSMSKLRFITTNTISHPSNVIDVAAQVAGAAENLLRNMIYPPAVPDASAEIRT